MHLVVVEPLVVAQVKLLEHLAVLLSLVSLAKNFPEKIDIQWSMTLTGMKLTEYMRGKMCHDRAFHFVNELHDFQGIHYLSGNFCYDDFFRKTHARL